MTLDTLVLDPLVGGRFLDPLVTRKVKGGYALACDLRYLARGGTLYAIPRGFVSDGASVPRPLWWLYPPFGGDYDRAVFLHDYLYQYAELCKGKDAEHIDRETCDALFLEAMEADKFRESGRWTVHKGVRLGGWWGWRKYRRAATKRAVEGGGV